MLNGGAPPNAKKELVQAFKKDFLDTKMIEKKYVDFIEKVVQTWRDYEHEKIKEIKGSEIDSLLKQTEDFLKRLKELRIQIEKKFNEKTIEQIYKDIFELLKSIVGKKSQAEIISSFEKEFVKKGKFAPQDLRILKNIIAAREEFKKGKSNSQKIDRARKDAEILINNLVEFSQRCDLVSLERGRMRLKLKDKVVEILNCDNKAFLFDAGTVKKVTTKIEKSSMEEVEKSIQNQKAKQAVEINPKIFETLKKELGNFEIII